METNTEILYGQLVIGAAGSGKTTFCKAMAQHLNNLNREVIIVNLDPDNDNIPYTSNVDIGDLVKLEEVMLNENLGPNGSFLFCFDLLERNFDWFYGRITEELNKANAKVKNINSSQSNCRRPYIIFDCPGQIELYTNYPTFKNIIGRLLNISDEEKPNIEFDNDGNKGQNKLDLRLATINIVDSHYASDPAKFITVIMNSLISMLHIQTPFINVLSKIDLMEQYGKTDFGIDFYCELPDLSRLVDRISDDPFLVKYKKLTESFASIIENYGLVSYVPLDINKSEMLTRVLNLIDRANGFYISDMSSNKDILNYYQNIQADFEASKYGT